MHYYTNKTFMDMAQGNCTFYEAVFVLMKKFNVAPSNQMEQESDMARVRRKRREYRKKRLAIKSKPQETIYKYDIDGERIKIRGMRRMGQSVLHKPTKKVFNSIVDFCKHFEISYGSFKALCYKQNIKHFRNMKKDDIIFISKDEYKKIIGGKICRPT